MDELIKSFYANRDPQRAVGMAAYMKNQFSFLGISRPDRSLLQKDFIKRVRRQGEVDWQDVYRLWDLPEREFQYLALDYLVALKDSLQPEDIYHLQTLILMKSWWDTVDKLAAIPVGSICLQHPEVVQNCLLPWADSDNIWLARTAILYQLKFKSSTDTEVLSSIIEKKTTVKSFLSTRLLDGPCASTPRLTGNGCGSLLILTPWPP